MTLRTQFATLVFAATVVVLAGCSTTPVATVSRDGRAEAARANANAAAETTTGSTVLDPRTGTVIANAPEQQAPASTADGTPHAQIRRGSGTVINRSAASAPPPNLGGTSGAATFNFEGESLQAVVKAILGDMLGQNYVIAPGVQGTVTLSTPRPVSPAQAMSLLEQVLGWNNARMVYADGRYNIVAADSALSGTVAPRTGSPALARGYEARVVPLKYISAEEMKKVLQPYARPNAIITTDNARNVITIGGTRSELENYMRTIEIFDVDWLQGMSVGVFPLKSGKASKVVADLEKVFGETSKSPVAGMFRFLPLDGANAVLVITSQPKYLDDIQAWLDRIEGAGGEVQLFSYELKYVKAKELADRLSEVFGGGRNNQNANTGAPSLMPGLESTEIKDSGVDDTGNSSASLGNESQGSGGGLGGGSLALEPRTGNNNGSVTLQVNGDSVGVSAVDETNTLLVRANPGAWQSIREVIERLDVMPLQVHIEAQVAEVKLSGLLRYGVNWFFENAIPDPTLRALAQNRTIVGDTAGSIGGISLDGAGNSSGGLSWTFLGRNALAVISALDTVSDVNLLQTPSVVVRNNAEATFNVGSRIPISSVSFNPDTNTSGTISQVQYLDTGTILKVRPRVTKDGVVFLDLVQEVSSPGSEADQNGNVRIDTRRLKTEAAIQSGDTIMLAGLISDGVTRGSSGVPGLSRIPWIGGLFGTQTTRTDRTEVIVLLTATVIRSPQEAADLTDEYGRRFRALEPLYKK
ncbi:type II secretion system protein D [Lysobacter helvus]|uniref:Type II secretion system protein D n=2 Tax=Lysobacteraceae TaxID=32033 RepID=A0ABM7Q3E6_9GAMM|nr:MULTISPECIES: type II secretion system secretin GspD [Lysobacter]BCT91801.1 type II secretion system protein D [Lysobacter caseinilyticus]BCT94954.1 type II secretion system protein D [Lysobacter helvus]